MSTHTLSVLVENKPGVLAHVAGMFSRRAFNISSLAVGPTGDERVSRMTIVVDGASTPVEQVAKQLDKLVRVLKVVELDSGASVERELALIKVRIEPARRGELLEVATVFHASVVDMSPTTIILEAVSSPAKLDSLLANLERYGTCELVRTGRIAIGRGSGTIIADRAAHAGTAATAASPPAASEAAASDTGTSEAATSDTGAGAIGAGRQAAVAAGDMAAVAM
jgi:acetolactate synthase I/III small subunit